jgi:hypothetical protein
MFDALIHFRMEIENTGRTWRDIAAVFAQPQALIRPSPSMNHALWLTGHMTWAEDFLLLEVPTKKTCRRKEWDLFFDHSSEKMPGDRYPPWKDVRAEYTRVHAEIMRHLAKLNRSDLDRPAAVERQWFPNAAHSIAHQATHGHYHLGQLVYLQKLLVK